MENMTGIRKNYSKKREAILDALRQTSEHPSAEMLYALLKPRYPELSLGTVYRNLSVFVEEGEVICVGTVDGQERYDADTSCHAHFICTRCSSFLDVDIAEDMTTLYSAIETGTGARVSGHELIFRGKCKNCCEKGS